MSLFDELTKAKDDANFQGVFIFAVPVCEPKTKMLEWLKDSGGTLYIGEKIESLAGTLKAIDAQGKETVYYLPCDFNTGLYIDIPPATSLSPKIFLTANLNGCFVGFRKDGNNVRVCHYNFCDFKAQKGDFDLYTHWIAPDETHTSDGTIMSRDTITKLFNVSKTNITFYNNKKQKNSVSVFGLFDNNWVCPNKWRFYLHDNNDEGNPVKTAFTN